MLSGRAERGRARVAQQLAAAGYPVAPSGGSARVAGDGSGRWLLTGTDPDSGDAIASMASTGSLFVKIGTGGDAAPRELLEYERAGLLHLRSAALAAATAAEGHHPSQDERPPRPQPVLVVPEPLLVGEAAGGSAFLAMGWMELQDGGLRGKAAAEFGRGLARLHKAPPRHGAFGFELDGCCGAHPQFNNVQGRQLNWVEFWREYRLGAQLDGLQGQFPSDRAVQDKGRRISAQLDELFSGKGFAVESVRRSCLHGDLWAGNVGVECATGQPCIFDPAAYYGHSEADLGIARMFGGFPRAFWEAYQAELPPSPGYEERAILYELHHHVNHYNLFGSGYRSGVLRLMDSLIAALPRR